MEEVGEECGICAVYLKNPHESSSLVPDILVKSLSILQPRGQKSAGIAVYNPRLPLEDKRKTINRYIGLGRVNEVFRVRDEREYCKLCEDLKGIAGIAHNRYATSGKRNTDLINLAETQPFIKEHPRSWKRFAMAFNGNLANYDSLCEVMEYSGYDLETNVDTEILVNLWALALRENSLHKDDKLPQKPSLFDVSKKIMDKADGAYNILTLSGDGSLVIMRDKHGIRPLVYGENEEYYIAASESIVLEKMGIKEYRDVLPGEVIICTSKGAENRRIIEEQKRFCHFELVYFARQYSTMEGVKVKECRENLGRELAMIEPLKDKLDSDFVVVPAPKTAITAAKSYAHELNLPIKDALEKGDERGFINGLSERTRIMGEYLVYESDVRNKKIILVDDSIVRGETSKVLIKILRNNGALEIHLRSTEPAILNPCFYGIDFPDKKELIAARLKNKFPDSQLEEILAKEIGADSIVFQTLNGLIRATKMPEKELCLACLNGDYPTQAGKLLYEKQINCA